MLEYEEENAGAIVGEIARLTQERPFGFEAALVTVANIAAQIRLGDGHRIASLLAEASRELGLTSEDEATVKKVIECLTI